jgi:hypothetical protein
MHPSKQQNAIPYFPSPREIGFCAPCPDDPFYVDLTFASGFLVAALVVKRSLLPLIA